MSFVIKTLLAACWLVVIPSLSGVVIIKKQDHISWGESYLFGLIYMMALSEVLILPMILADIPLTALVVTFAVLMCCTALAGIVIIIKKEWIFGETWKIIRMQKIWFYLAAAVIVLQILYVCLYAHFDADDSFYIGTATTAVQTDTIFSVSPYTGYSYEVPPARYVLSPFPVLLAVISRLSGGMHPAVIAHMFYSALFLFASYIVLFMTARRLFSKDIEAQGRFLFLAAVIEMCSAYSVYNREQFAFVRIWQGKAFLAAVIVPLTFYLGLSLIMAKNEKYSWPLLLITCIAACLTSTMSVAIMPLSIGIMALIGAYQYKNIKKIIYSFLCVLPCIALGIIYYMIK